MDKINDDYEISSAMKAAISDATIIEYLPLIEQDRELNWTEFDWEEILDDLCVEYQLHLHAESGKLIDLDIHLNKR